MRDRIAKTELVEFMRSVKPFIGFSGAQMVETAEAVVNLLGSEGASLVQEKFSTLLLGRGAASMAVTPSTHGNPYTLFLILFLLMLSDSFDHKYQSGQTSDADLIPADLGSAEEDAEE